MNLKLTILEQISEDFNISTKDILGESRMSEIVDARCVLASVFFDLKFSKSEIGRYLNRDHTTIINLIKRVEKSEILSSLRVSYTQIFKHKINGFNKRHTK